MSRVWITSDLHIGHNKDYIFRDRGFKSIEEHDRALVANWNELVGGEDIVYILGDVMLKHDLDDTDFAYGLSVLEQLKGKLVIIRGNHDTVGKSERYKSLANVLRAGEAALYLDYPESGRYHFYLTHYPTLISHKKLKSVKTALINIYGHTHQKEHFYNNHPYMYCACMDAHDLKPVLLDEIIEEIKLKRSEYGEMEELLI